MGERLDLLQNLKHLIELDRGFGIEFMPRISPGTVSQVVPPAVAPLIQGPAAPAAPPPAATPAPSLLRDAPLAIPSSGLPAVDLEAIATEISDCTKCALSGCRKRTVPGEGNPGCELLFVGEGPGAEEDLQGRPFVGPAGELLTRMIVAMGLTRDEVFIANVVKCRPPGNRTPQPEEVAACMPFLRRQIAVLRPKLICTLGNTPLRALLGDDSLGITRVRGKQLDFGGIPLIPTFHPSYLLRNPDAKKPCWEDLQTVLKALGRSLPPRRTG